MYEAIKAGEIFDCPEQPTISDSTAGGLEPDSITFGMCAKLIDEHVLVTEEEIKQAMRLLIEKERWIVEGATTDTPAIREQFGPLSNAGRRGVGNGFAGYRLPAMPTTAPPGSPEK